MNEPSQWAKDAAVKCMALSTWPPERDACVWVVPIQQAIDAATAEKDQKIADLERTVGHLVATGEEQDREIERLRSLAIKSEDEWFEIFYAKKTWQERRVLLGELLAARDCRIEAMAKLLDATPHLNDMTSYLMCFCPDYCPRCQWEAMKKGT